MQKPVEKNFVKSTTESTYSQIIYFHLKNVYNFGLSYQNLTTMVLFADIQNEVNSIIIFATRSRHILKTYSNNGNNEKVSHFFLIHR